ncbi:hypothetical protein BJ742DRAFT_460792 [Cladochytrium replicatum]|nr:hypothetical protein BJ742DRAFT_460792 [Cladochytrium replicatum]
MTKAQSDQGKGTTREGTNLQGFELKVGDHVLYHGVEGGTQATKGVIQDILTETEVAEHTSTQNVAKASADEPRYVIKNDNTEKGTAYYKKSIEKKLEE